MREVLPAHFDADWYLGEYADVRVSGMDPYEHYLWLGCRLNRLPAPPLVTHPVANNTQRTPLNRTNAPQPTPYDEPAVFGALERLCNWLVPEGAGKPGSLAARDLFDALRWDFGNSMIDGVTHINPNAHKLVDFMSTHDSAPDPAARFSLPAVAEGTRSILLTSYYAPTLAHAGGLRLLDTYALIRKQAPHVHLTLFAPRHEEVDGNLSELRDIFDDVHFCRPEQFRSEWLLQRLHPGQRFDLVDLQFHQAGRMAREFRALARRIIFTPMETLSRFPFDEVRSKALNGELDHSQLFSTVHDGAMEREIMAEVDMTVCVSDADAGFLAQVTGAHQVNYYPTGLSTIEFKRELATDYTPPPFAEKYNRLVFAAYFGSETNRLGLQWYLENVHPLVLAAVPDYDLAVVGRGDTAMLEALGAQSVCFIGEVPNLAPVLEQAKAGLVLAINGSGFRGKINQYALCGLSVISTPLGATGLTYEHGRDIVIADGPEAFAQACISLLTDPAQGALLAAAGRRRALEHYSWDGIWPRIAAIYGISTAECAQ